MKITQLCIVLILLVTSVAKTQSPQQPNSSEILHKLNRLNVLGSVLYVAAHPDDENTRLIAYLVNEKHYNTAYLSATRGDGGQNLIGSQIRESLGLIRTQELLAARRTDGGTQYFSRANDFGYSKNPVETFNIWDKNEVLADFVKVFRKHRPDVVITRFPGDGRGGHGHHTASAILAKEAFLLSSDPKSFPQSAEEFGVWQPKRLMFNTHPFFYRRGGGEFDSTGLLSVDTGEFNALLGQSYTEIAAHSRSMHKSQGFGTLGTRGESMEYLQYIAGDSAVTDLFDGVNQTWSRVLGSEAVAAFVEDVILHFDPENPHTIIPELVNAYQSLDELENGYWKSVKQNEIKILIKDCMGLYLEAKSDSETYAPGDSINISIEAINRSDFEIELHSIDFEGIQSFEVRQKLYNNRPFNADKKYQLRESITYSQPYWLDEQGTLGMYQVSDYSMIGKPENDPSIAVMFTLKVGEVFIDYKSQVIYKRSDPVEGEVYSPVVITPPVFANLSDRVLIFPDDNDKDVTVTVIAGKDSLNGEIALGAPKGWEVSPASLEFFLANEGQSQDFVFKVAPPKKQSEGVIQSKVQIGSQTFSYGLEEISFDHLPKQTLFPQSQAKVVKINLEKRGDRIAYITGAGDDIPASLRQIGYSVDELGDEPINSIHLQKYDAVILGIRAYNTRKSLKFENEELMKYVKSGGTVITQYNTSHRLVTEKLAPYDIKLSRDRVSVEDAEIRILLPNHEVLNSPNKITMKDFTSWTQERGLYFPNEWDEKFEAILSSNDPGEDEKRGGLLIGQYGEGYFIYTGYSWFRQLPAGVPGAFRIYSNMISIGK